MPDETHSEAAPEPEEPATLPGRPDATARPIAVDGVYRDGAIHLSAPLDLQPGAPVSLLVTPGAATTAAAPAPRRFALRSLPALPAVSMRLAPADVALLLLGLLVYAASRLLHLDRFPIYFFSDEAIQVTQAEFLLQHGLRDPSGTWLPPYFQNLGAWNLGLSVYLHAVSVAMFGKSIAVARATSVAVSILGVAAVSLMLKQIFRLRLWWAGVLVLAALPTWFLHSRTAFETVMMVSFYACFLYCYLLYRYRSSRYLVPALLFGAATFYSYSNGQGVMLVSGVLLVCSDLRYHLRQPRRTLLLGLVAALVLAVPYLRFRALHGDAVSRHLNEALNSYWFQARPLGDKLATFVVTYLNGLSPRYWFWPDQPDMDRHQMKGMGRFSLLALPFVLVGLGICLRRWRSPAHRVVLIAVLSAPFAAALVGIGITRVLAMVVPATLLIVIGLEACAGIARKRVPGRALEIAGAAILLLLCVGVTRAALINGPTWYSDYGLYGMQYGAAQVFGASRDVLGRSPDTQIFMSPSWANNPDVFGEFFLTETERGRITMQSIDTLLQRKRKLSPSQLFVLPQDEYKVATSSPKLHVEPPELIVDYPDGNPGFYFVRISYSAVAGDIFAAEYAVRQQPDEGKVQLNGQDIGIRYSKLDQGRPGDMFDGDGDTLIRGLEANPLILELFFPTARTIRGIKLHTASMNYRLRVETSNGYSNVVRTTATYRDLPADPQVDYALPGGPASSTRLRIEITELDRLEDVHIHVRELELY